MLRTVTDAVYVEIIPTIKRIYRKKTVSEKLNK